MYKIIILILFSVTLLSCSDAINKQELADNFVDMRTIPADILTIEKMGNYEIAYQAEEDLSDRYFYPDNYAIGRINDAGDGYEYIVYVVGISPIDEYEYVKSILDQFETDTTYVDVLLKEDDKIRANIYRKTNSPNALNMNFMMWKWVETPQQKLRYTPDLPYLFCLS